MTAPALKSSDYDQNPKSFTLDTGDGYFIKPTVAYVKGTPAAHADAVTVIVWFHGFYVDKRGTIFKDVKDQEVKLLETLKACPIDELIFIAPFMGDVHWVFVLDEHNEKIPLRDKAGNIRPGKFEKKIVGSSDYRDAEAELGKAADSYLAKVLEGLASFLDSKGQALTGGDGKPRTAFVIKNLILACHSGGGVAMRAFVGGLGTNNKAALKGCWCFDCLYGGDDADFWFKRGPSAAPFYAYYNDTETNAKSLLKKMGHERDAEFSEGGNLNVIDNSAKNHYRTASEGFPERLKDPKLKL
jgi:hypothetical protein